MTSVLPPPGVSTGSPIEPPSDQNNSQKKALPSKKEIINALINDTAKDIQKSNTLTKEQALNILLAAEKRARLAQHPPSTWKACLAILDLVGPSSQNFSLDELINYIRTLFKKRQQSESVQSQIINYAAHNILPKVKGRKEAEVELVNALRDLSAGLIQLEQVRAELTLGLVELIPKGEAWKMISTETPETYATLDTRKKLEFLVCQLDLAIADNQLFQANIIYGKIEAKLISRFDDLNIRFNLLMVELFTQKRNAFELSKCYRNLVDIKLSKDDKDIEVEDDIIRMVIYLCASPAGPDQQSTLEYFANAVHKDITSPWSKKLRGLRQLKKLMLYFIRQEVITWPLNGVDMVMDHPLLTQGGLAPGKTTADGMHDLELTPNNWVAKSLFKSIVYHDLAVLGNVYTQIPLGKINQMFLLKASAVEDCISEMITGEDAGYEFYAKIDRPNGVVVFGKTRSTDEVLDEWQCNINKLLRNVDEVCHLIEKEKMLSQAGVLPK